MDNPDSNSIALGNRLKMARELAGLSQGQVAKMMNLHRPSISESEAGRRKVKAEELVEYARIYGVDLAWLAGSKTEEADFHQDRIELAARELAKMKVEDVGRLLELLSVLRQDHQDA